MTMSAQQAAANTWIAAAYETLAAQGGFTVRDSQKQLSVEVATAILTGRPLVAEAPTGTGKTLAYLLGALGVIKTRPQGEASGVVVSTATKALQQQLTTNDVPKLASAGLFSADLVRIAKGKGNYICIKQAEEVASRLEQSRFDPEVFLDEELAGVDPDIVGAMVQAFRDSYWDGDFDSYDRALPKNVRPIAVSSDTCQRKKCPHFSDCAFYEARNQLSDAQIVVANHDLVLSDLKVALETDGVLPLSKYTLIVDEGHHLPEKAIKAGSTNAPLTSLLQALPKLAGVQKLMRTNPPLLRVGAGVSVVPEDFDRHAEMQALMDLIEVLNDIDVEEDSCQCRFVGGVVPPRVVSAIHALEVVLTAKIVKMQQLCDAVRDSEYLEKAGLNEIGNELLFRLTDVKNLASQVVECAQAIASTKRLAKWLFKKETTVTLNTAPLEAADVLQPLMWNHDRLTAKVIVSATLRDLGGFSRFAARTGAPMTTRYMVTPHSFPYHKSRLVVPAMQATPKMVERQYFMAEFVRKLPQAINPQEATLVLFPSWSMMRELAPVLRSHFGEQMVRVQGGLPLKMLVREHCEAVDRGEGSILVGVATMAEGLDLPGDYCTHVIIATLPFAVPSDPVEQELADLLGNKYFSERSLPDAMVRLTQMVGRLLRRESDVGQVTIFDRRLASTSYGQKMLRSLPPFQKVIEPMPK